MATHDYSIANADGATVRTDINNCLAAIVSLNSSTSAPGTTFAYMLWADTTNGLLKQRNSTNSGWVTVGTLDATTWGLLARAGGTMTGDLTLDTAAKVLLDDSVTAAGANLPLCFDGDTNTGIYRPQSDTLALATGGFQVLRVTNAASAANYVQVTASAATAPPLLQSVGSDTNIDFRIEGKGSGTLRSESVYNSTTASAANLFINSGGQMARSTSSIRYKRDVTDYDRGLEDLLKLRAVFYRGKSAADADMLFAGFIAEEVHEAGLNEFVVYDKDGQPDALHYSHMTALLTRSVQQLAARVAELEASA